MMNEYAYVELVAAATKFDATQEEINALGEWFEHYGMRYWNGSCWTVDEKEGIYLAPICKEIAEDEFETVGYTFSSETVLVDATFEGISKKDETVKKSYKDFEKKFIGASDIAALVLVGYNSENGVLSQMLNFGRDGSYYAYIVPADAEIGAHYTEVAHFSAWMSIYDDGSFIGKFCADDIRVFRAGEMGCIIQLKGKKQ